MTGDTMQPMPASPRQSPARLGNAFAQWGKSRRGRVLLLTGAMIFLMLVFTGAGHSERLSSSYNVLASNYHLPSWRPHLPHLPSMIHSPTKPSNTTLQLEAGELEHVPAQLKKTTPSFHLLMASLDDSPEFCKSTLSAMLLNLPPPTVVNLFESFNSQKEREKTQLSRTLGYLKTEGLVQEDDLVLFVDGRDTWFQLPSEVIIRQYQNVLDAANKHLVKAYGNNASGMQNFNQTIVFGAEKLCEADDMACKYAPPSVLPDNIYGRKTGKRTETTPARYLDSGMIMGPVKDLKVLFEAALKKFEDENSQAATVQSVFATMFGEQQLARDSVKKKSDESKTASIPSKWFDWFGGSAAEPVPVSQIEVEDESVNMTLQANEQYEFAIGLDYTHSLFQPFLSCAQDELVALPHDNSTDLDQYRHAGTPTPPLKIPTALEQANPPFWTPDLSKNNPSPNKDAAHIERLDHTEDLDTLRPRDTTWAELSLIQNTYTGSVPAILHTNTQPHTTTDTKLRTRKTSQDANIPSASIQWTDLWYSDYSRALLRKHFRTRQSPLGYHAAAVGGDRMWDQRGGRGGVWTVKQEIWLPWGEVDGVCGTLKQVKEVFGDGRGVWLHEHDENAEEERLKEEEELKKKIEEAKKKDEERRKKKEEEEKKAEEEKKKKGGDKRR